VQSAAMGQIPRSTERILVYKQKMAHVIMSVISIGHAKFD